LEPGSQCVCRVTLEAGITPQVFEAEVRCHVCVDEESAMRHVTDAMSEAPEDFVHEVTDSGSVVEETLHLSPDRTRKLQAHTASSR
jgi:hypothetical protein